MNWETMLCLGDSITNGSRSYLGYPEYAASMLKSKTDTEWSVVNFAHNGYTAIELHKVLCNQFHNLKAHNAQIITLLIGTNDIKKGTPVSLFEKAYYQLVLKAKLLMTNTTIVLIDIPRFSKNIRYPYRMDMNGDIDRYNQVIRQAAKGFGLRRFEFQFGEGDFFDGVHLNEAGAEKAGHQLASLILKDKGFEDSTDIS